MAPPRAWPFWFSGELAPRKLSPSSSSSRPRSVAAETTSRGVGRPKSFRKSSKFKSLSAWKLFFSNVCFVALVFALSARLVVEYGVRRISDRYERRVGPLPSFCKNKAVYIYDLPSDFNSKLIAKCSMMPSADTYCQALSNQGLGSEITTFEYVLETSFLGPVTGWYNTKEFALEVLFHHRLLSYPCRTENPSEADAFYIPYYATLSSMFYSESNTNLFVPINASDDFHSLLEHLQNFPTFTRRKGHDHFLVLSKSPYAFRNSENNANMMYDPYFKNMIKLTTGKSFRFDSFVDDAEIGVPFPSFFHPKNAKELKSIMVWSSQGDQRTKLVTLLASYDKSTKGKLRTFLIRQCKREISKCHFSLCNEHPYASDFDHRLKSIKNQAIDCSLPTNIVPLYHQSHFCLHPFGRTNTKKSIFDSLICGCIPVFFDDRVYDQYKHYFPSNSNSWSVFISENQLSKSSIVRLLSQIPAQKRKNMRKVISNMLPTLLYSSIPWNSDPLSSLELKNSSFNVISKSTKSKARASSKSRSEFSQKLSFKKKPNRRLQSVHRKKKKFSSPKPLVITKNDAISVALYQLITMIRTKSYDIDSYILTKPSALNDSGNIITNSTPTLTDSKSSSFVEEKVKNVGANEIINDLSNSSNPFQGKRNEREHGLESTEKEKNEMGEDQEEKKQELEPNFRQNESMNDDTTFSRELNLNTNSTENHLSNVVVDNDEDSVDNDVDGNAEFGENDGNKNIGNVENDDTDIDVDRNASNES